MTYSPTALPSAHEDHVSWVTMVTSWVLARFEVHPSSERHFAAVWMADGSTPAIPVQRVPSSRPTINSCATGFFGEHDLVSAWFIAPETIAIAATLVLSSQPARQVSYPPAEKPVT